MKAGNFITLKGVRGGVVIINADRIDAIVPNFAGTGPKRQLVSCNVFLGGSDETTLLDAKQTNDLLSDLNIFGDVD